MADNTITVMLEPINLIHCKDCKYFSIDYCKRNEDEWHVLSVEPDDYCIHAERKDNG